MPTNLVRVIEADLRHGTGQFTPTTRFWPVAVGKLFLYPRLRAVLAHRLAHALWRRPPLRPIALLLQARTLRVCGAEIHPAATIGPGFLLMHSAGVVIHPEAVIGADVVCFQGVTLGERDGRNGSPIVGNRVRLGANATILGPVVIGDGALIGAGAVVLSDVPAMHVAIGHAATSQPRRSH